MGDRDSGNYRWGEGLFMGATIIRVCLTGLFMEDVDYPCVDSLRTTIYTKRVLIFGGDGGGRPACPAMPPSTRRHVVYGVHTTPLFRLPPSPCTSQPCTPTFHPLPSYQRPYNYPSPPSTPFSSYNFLLPFPSSISRPHLTATTPPSPLPTSVPLPSSGPGSGHRGLTRL